MPNQQHLAAVAIVLAIPLAFSPAAAGQGVRGFGTPDGQLPLRGFGTPAGELSLRKQFPRLAVSVSEEDRQAAVRHMRETDLNGDQVITEAEYRAAGEDMKWFPINDLNGDKLLPLDELILRYTQHRLSKEDHARRQREGSPNPSDGQTPPRLSSNAPAPLADPQVQARQRQTRDLAAFITRTYDLNENNIIEASELRSQVTSFRGLASADGNRDGEIHRNELSTWLLNRLPPLPASRLAVDLQPRDADQDGQVSLREFAPEMTTELADEFNGWDRNRDGLITAAESQNPPSPKQLEYTNGEPQVLKAFATIVSPIRIKEDVSIEDLDVYLMLNKEFDTYTEVHLLGPDGRRATLYAGNGWVPWRNGLVLKQVNFDDQAPFIKQPLPQPPPPYDRKLRPPGVGVKGESSLADFNGSGTRGLWRLLIHNQNNRVGLLMRWSLTVTSAEEDPR